MMHVLVGAALPFYLYGVCRLQSTSWAIILDGDHAFPGCCLHNILYRQMLHCKIYTKTNVYVYAYLCVHENTGVLMDGIFSPYGKKDCISLLNNQHHTW